MRKRGLSRALWIGAVASIFAVGSASPAAQADQAAPADQGGQAGLQPPAPSVGQPLPGVLRYTTLSDERRLTRWAHALEQAPARTQPSASARIVGRLRFDTEDRYPEVYLALRAVVDPAGREWVQVRLPMRPNGTTGWVPRGALDDFVTVATYLQVDTRSLRATLYRRGRPIWQAPIGVGRRGTETPRGLFYIRERLSGIRGASAYGPLAFGTSAYSNLSEWPGGGVVGIHGTDQPQGVPGRPSHGCIRLRNKSVLRLGKLMPVGTPVRIV